MKVTYKKLKDGRWGLCVVGENLGDLQDQTLEVTKKNGDKKKETVLKVLWKGDNQYGPGEVAFCSIRKKQTKKGYRYSRTCHTDGNCSSMCMNNPECPCRNGGWFDCC